MTKQDGMYVISINMKDYKSSNLNLSQFHKDYFNWLGVRLAHQVDVPYQFDKQKIERFSQTVWIDAKTFEIEKVKHDVKITIPKDIDAFYWQQDTVEVKVKSKFTGSI